jgi:hypothetical protein
MLGNTDLPKRVFRIHRWQQPCAFDLRQSICFAEARIGFFQAIGGGSRNSARSDSCGM